MAGVGPETGQPPQAAGDHGGESPGAAPSAAALPAEGPVTPEAVLAKLAEAVAQLASATSGPSASGGQWKESKWIKSPEVFHARNLDEEVALWPDWSFGFKNFMAVQDDEYRGDFEKAEKATAWVSFEHYSPALRARSLRLYSVLASYLKGRALKILRATTNGDGFRVWRQLTEELQPTTRPRTLALAQALTKFPPLRDGGSVLEYTLTFEKLISEYERASSQVYPDDLKISTLLSGLPQDVKRFLQLQIDDTTTYQKLRGILLQFERTSATWSNEYIMKAIGLEKNSYPGDGNNPVPMDVDRVEGKGKGKEFKGKGKGQQDKGKGKGKWFQDGGKKGKNGKGYSFGGFGGFGKGQQDKGKGKGKWFQDGGKKGKKGGFVKGQRVNQVEDDSASVGTRVNRLELNSMPLIEELPDDLDDTFGACLGTRSVSEFGFYEGTEAWDEEAWGEEEDWWDYAEVPADAYEYIRAVRVSDAWCSGEKSELNGEFVCEPVVDFSECELPSSSTLCFELDRDDSGDEFVRAEREVRAVTTGTNLVEPCEVILDSGADITVLPAHLFGSVGIPEEQTAQLLDAQGTPIPQFAQRANVSFIVESRDGQEFIFRDRAVLARVKQPLLCAGKLFRGGWYPRPSSDEDGSLVMCKGDQEFPIYFSRNSIACSMRIMRTEEVCIRAVIEVSNNLAELKRAGWQVTEGSTPTHVQMSSNMTVDPSSLYDPAVLPHRTTLVHKGGNRFEIFECGEFWELKPPMDIGCEPTKIVTLLTRGPLEPADLGKPVEERVGVVPRFQDAPGREVPQPEAVVDGTPGDPQQGARVGPEMQEIPLEGEVVKLGDKEVRETSSLRDLRWACKYLRIPHTGAKHVLWTRLQKEVALNKLKVAVQASDAVIAEYTPDVNHGPLPQRPDAQTVMLHELTHLPRADWCESCQAALSREDPHREVQPKREVPVISVDWMFNRTGDAEDEEHPLTTQLVAVCHSTKYVVCVPVRSKAAEDNKPAVEELVKMASILGYAKVTFRGDTEPSMLKLLQMVQMARTRLGLETEVERAHPDSSEHQGVRAERYIDKVRRLGLCLLHTVAANSKYVIKSSHPIYPWAFRHAAFLLTRYHVHSDGVSSYELVHGRKYDAKIAAFGSVVFSQMLPKPKTKGIPWEKCIYLGRSTMGSLSIVSTSKGIGYARTVRRAAEAYQADALVAMRGVPWDPVLDVVTMRVPRAPRLRVPELVEAAPDVPAASGPGAGDEAGTDPPTSIAESPGESILDGLSGSGSDELIPAAMDVSRVECFPVRVIRDDQPHGHEDDDVVCEPEESLEPQGQDDFESEEEAPESSEPEKGDAGMPWEGRTYAQGPPELEAQVLQELDKQMELKELDRLLGMNVLRHMTGEHERDDKVRLQCKYVLDWRFRGGWVRRARLVAKEYRFLEPSLTDLYSPASVASSHKLLACLAAGNDSLELVSLDITDAYLQVRQRRPTYIQTHLGDLELCYNLPGQRAGAKDWFTHLLGILKKRDLKSFDGNPALFGQEQNLALNSHVDDLQILGLKGVPMKLADALKEEGLKVKVDGPVGLDGGYSHFLKKKFQGLGGAIEVTQDTKYAERLQSILELEKAHGKQNPCPTKVPPPGDGETLDAEHLHLYKRCVGILMYMSAERPDLQYIVKVLSSRSSSPTVSDYGLLRHVVKYLKLHPVIPIVLEKTVPGRTLAQKWKGVEPDDSVSPSMPFGAKHIVEVVTDADWGSQAFSERRSISSYCIFVNGNLCHAGNRVQKVISLSSAESELMATLLGLSEGIFIKGMLEFLVGPQAEVKLVHMVDNSATRSILQRQGLGRTRHVSLGYLWAQKALNEGVFETKAIATKDCPADLQTKPHSRSRLTYLLSLMGAGGRVAMESRVASTTINAGAGQILRALAVFLEGGVVTGQLVAMEGDAVEDGNEGVFTMWYVMHMFTQLNVTVMFLVIFAVMVGVLMCMAPRRRWNRQGDGNAQPSNQNELRDRIHTWFAHELRDELNPTTSVENQSAVPPEEDDYERWLVCNEPQPNSDDDAGGAAQAYLDSFVPDEALLQQFEDRSEVAEEPRDQMPVSPEREFYMIGEPRSGKGYHTPQCGQVRKWQRSLPSNLRLAKLSLLESYRMKPCKQCKPYPLDQ
ncbi:unnamed protein product [Symbiodinium necroappetens]|uniref:Peptidase A2 domain-containing protein n=1 Tax=Symbiodinium necroappetens TaxID=1628268 RepID=A0A812VJR5_9DINO|nr:unnamed protein product [Symbiodinium necroappetens]